MKSLYKALFVFMMVLFIYWGEGCEKKEQATVLTVNPTNLSFPEEGGIDSITIETNADSWNISNPASDWLLLSNTSGTTKTAIVKASVNSKSVIPRSDTLTVTAGDAKPVKVIVSQAASDFLYTLSANDTSLSFSQPGGTIDLTIYTDAPRWNLTADAEWIQFSQVSGNSGNTTITVTTSENSNIGSRTALISLTAEEAPVFQIKVVQKGRIYPGYNVSPAEPDPSGMSSNAEELASKIVIGWNIGNSLEAIGGETAWGNPRITQALIDLVKQSGFNAVRIPCSWNQYMANSATAQLKTDWLNRVKEVVQYCINNDMYVLLNIHWDGGWLENNCTLAKQEENNAKQQAFWEQIAAHLRDFDEHLLFASANEPNVSDATQMAVLSSYHQTFINAVRSTGGKNSYRVLVIQGPSTDIEKTNKFMSVLPSDNVPNRLMVEIHYYTPWNFCGLTEDATWGKMFYYWGKDYHSTTDPERNASWGEEETVDANFKLMKTKFTDLGIPVILGEYSAVRRSALTGDALTNHLASRAFFFKYVTKQAKANGLIPFYWDNGATGNNGSALFNRNTNTVFDQQALDALIQGATE
jgi:aryl-phospho-beta-D-glucosidase BglC (GH1 family)